MGPKQVVSKRRKREPERAGLEKQAPPPSSEGEGACKDGQEKDKKARKKLWFLRSPLRVLATLTVLLGGPRITAVAYHWLHLRSTLLGGLGPLDVSQKRQLLVVGTMGAGTSQMNLELKGLGLETGHEVSDSEHEYCREGTVSHAHALRFFQGVPNTKLLCREPRFNAYHSSMMRESKECSYYFRWWDECWARECRAVTLQEYGCAVSGGNNTCITPFARSLLQVRHPLRTIASLVYKSGGEETACSNGEHQLAVIQSLLPDGFVRRHLGLPDFHWADKLGCREQFAWYWVLYNKAVMPHVDGWYRVEDTPPCKVARMAGFLDEDYAAGQGKGRPDLEQTCRDRLASSDGPGRGEAHGYHNRKNTGNLVVSWQDLMDISPELHNEVARLAAELGYWDAPKVEEQEQEEESAKNKQPERSPGKKKRGGWTRGGG